MALKARNLTAPLVALLLITGAAAGSDDPAFVVQGTESFFGERPCPVRDFPDFELPVIVPPLTDLSNGLAVTSTSVVTKSGNPVARAKGTLDYTLTVLHNTTSTFELLVIGNNRIRTGEGGIHVGGTDIQAATLAPFAADFEKGDVTLLVNTIGGYSNRKKADAVSVVSSVQPLAASDP